MNKQEIKPRYNKILKNADLYCTDLKILIHRLTSLYDEKRLQRKYFKKDTQAQWLWE